MFNNQIKHVNGVRVLMSGNKNLTSEDQKAPHILLVFNPKELVIQAKCGDMMGTPQNRVWAKSISFPNRQNPQIGMTVKGALSAVAFDVRMRYTLLRAARYINNTIARS